MNRERLFPCVIALMILFFSGFGSDLHGALPTGPEQPAMGPGGSTYPHASFRVIEIGEWETKSYIYEPQEPRPASAPVLLFFHGWFQSKPEYYEGWLRHLCRRGWIVIFPQYQGSGEKFEYFNTNAALAVKKAMRYLNDGESGITPDRDRCATIGHECGAVVGANLAAAARYFKIPVPQAIMALTPSRATGLDFYDLTAIQAGTLLLLVVGEDDQANGVDAARQMFYAADHLATRDKSYLTMLSDTHGTPALMADRFAPLAPIEPLYVREVEKRRWEFLNAFRKGPHTRFVRSRGIDAMDFLGSWRLFDAMIQILRENGDRKAVFDNTEEQRFMGQWSDGKPVRGFISTDRP